MIFHLSKIFISCNSGRKGRFSYVYVILYLLSDISCGRENSFLTIASARFSKFLFQFVIGTELPSFAALAHVLVYLMCLISFGAARYFRSSPFYLCKFQPFCLFECENGLHNFCYVQELLEEVNNNVSV